MPRPTLVFRLHRTLGDLVVDISAVDLASAPPPCSIPIVLDHTLLLSQSLNPQQYGLYLSRQLFGHPQILTCWNAAVQNRGDDPVCLRLVLPADDPILHSIRWELLQVPAAYDGTVADGAERHIGLRTDVIIVRTVEGAISDREPVIAQHADLRALVVIANPRDLAAYRLEPLQVDFWAEQARALLGDCALTIVGPETGAYRPTFKTLSTLLSAGYDILYLVCHGTLLKGESYLWLEGPDGKVDRIAGAKFVPAVTGVANPPRLVLFATCNSATAPEVPLVSQVEDRGLDTASLALQLSRQGVPATVAMQGPLQIKSAEAFFSKFCTGLFQHGEVDRAVSEGRRAISQSDWWVPTLFLQQQDARLWRPLSLEEIHLEWPRYSRLVDRRAEQEIIAATLARGEAVILQGEDGIGKRTLLTHIARQISEGHPRHLFWLTAGPDTDMGSVMEQLVTFVGRRTGKRFDASRTTAQLAPRNVLDWVIEGLQTLKPLLVLNEVDHLWSDPDFQSMLERLSPLVQDRTVLLLLSAQQLPDLPDKPWRSVLTLGGIAEADVADVILANGWVFPPQLANQSKLLHQLSEGKPLWLQMLLRRLAVADDPVATLERLRQLAEAGKDVPLLGTVELSPDDRTILAALDVLAESQPTQEAVLAVVGASSGDKQQVAALLSELCDAGLVRRIEEVTAKINTRDVDAESFGDDPRSGNNVPHYRLRRFRGSTRLLSAAELQAMHSRAASFFASREPFYTALHLFRSGEPALAAQTIISNLPTIIWSGHLKRADKLIDQLALTNLDPAIAAELKLVQAELRLLALEQNTARTAAARAEQFAQQLNDPQARLVIAARAARLQAAIHTTCGEFGAAITTCQKYLATPQFQALPAQLRGELYAELAEALYHEGELEEASVAIEAGLTEFSQSNASVNLKARLLMRSSTVAADRREAMAIALLQEAQALATEVRDLPLLARIRYNLGLEYDQRADGIAGLAKLEAARRLAMQIGDGEVQVYTQLAIGQHFIQRDEYATALGYLEEARDRLDSLGLIPGYVHALIDIGVLYFYWERYDEAQTNLKQAATFNRKRGQLGSELRLPTAIAELWLGELALVHGRFEDALRHAERALPRFKELEAISYEAMAHRLRGDSLLALGHVNRAAAALRKASKCDEQAGDPYDHMTLLVSRARLTSAKGKPKEACELLQEAQQCLADTPSRYHQRLIERALRDLSCGD